MADRGTLSEVRHETQRGRRDSIRAVESTPTPTIEAQVIRAERTAYVQVRNILADSFADDPIMAWMLSSRANTRTARRRLFGPAVRSALHAGIVEIAQNGYAATLWWPPGHLRTKGPLSLLRDLWGLGPAWRALGSGMARAHRFYEGMLHMRPTTPHWYLAAIGTVPRARRRGAASALLETRLAACDAQHLPAYLECSNRDNLALYERHGFEAGEMATLEGSPPFWPMSRVAR